MGIELVITACVQIAALGVFIGVTRTSLTSINERLERIEKKQDDWTKEFAELRERVAVIESVLEVKSKRNENNR